MPTKMSVLSMATASVASGRAAAAVTLGLLLALPAVGGAQCDSSSDICASGSAWYEFTRIVVEPFDASMPAATLTVHGGQDLSVGFTGVPKHGPPGRIIVVDGRAMLMRDVQHEAGYEIDALDGPVLMAQLVVTLLDQAFPAGPSSVRTVHRVQVEQRTRAIRIATASADARFEAPWTVSGTVRRRAEQVEYDLRFSARTADGPYALHARGRWQKEAKPTSLDDDMPLDGWKVHWLGPMTTTSADGTTFDYAAQPASSRWKDVAALRKWMSEEPARRASRRRPVDAANPGSLHSISYEAFVTDKSGARSVLGAAVRDYKPGSDVLAEETRDHAIRKTLSLGHGLSVSTDVQPKPSLTGFGLVLVNDSTSCFSWEWFDQDGGDVFGKLLGGGKVKVGIVEGAAGQELAAVEFLNDIVLDCEDPANGTVYHARIKQGSVLRLRP